MKPNEYKISSEKFNFVQDAGRIHDKELSTKPVGYLKDAFSRFKKNKGSIVAAMIILVLVLSFSILSNSTDAVSEELDIFLIINLKIKIYFGKEIFKYSNYQKIKFVTN